MVEEITDPEKIPVRPFIGADALPGSSPAWRESYIPSLDPVRKAGEFRIVSVAEAYPVEKARPVKPVTFGEMKLLASGYQQADTPAVLLGFAGRKEPTVVFAEAKKNQLFRYPVGAEGATAELFSSEAGRGRIGPDGRQRPGVFHQRPGRLVAGRRLLHDAQGSGEGTPLDVRSADGQGDGVVRRGAGREVSQSQRHRARLRGTLSLRGDFEPQEPGPGRAGVYCFPIRPDGTIDMEKGGQTAWVPVKADGFDIHGRSRGHVAVPKGTGTNLCFGPPNSPLADALFVTTWDSRYSVSVK